MKKEHVLRLEKINDYSNEMLEYLYFFEVLFPKTKEFLDNQEEYQVMLFDIIDEIMSMISGYGFLLEGNGSNEDNEKALMYIEGLMSDLKNEYPVEIDYTEEFMSWVKKHKGE